MTGDLYIQTTDATVISKGTYDLRTGSAGSYEYWLDCYYQWGVAFEDGALDVLMGFRPNKEPVVNKNVTADGAYYVTGAGHVDERTINVPFHIVTGNKADFLLKRSGFYNAIKTGLLTFKVMRPVEAIFKVYYVSCTQYTQYIDGLAKFMLTLYETNGGRDGDEATPQPMPEHDDMAAYLLWLLQTYGGLATEEEVREIVRGYNRGIIAYPHDYVFKSGDKVRVGGDTYVCTATSTTKPPFNFVFHDNKLVVDQTEGLDVAVVDSNTLNAGWKKV